MPLINLPGYSIVAAAAPVGDWQGKSTIDEKITMEITMKDMQPR